MGAAKEAVERNETAPSELVKRLTALAEEQVLDAELDPEGWGRAAAEQQQQQQPRKDSFVSLYSGARSSG